MHRVSRRRALAACGALALPAASGCSSYVPWSSYDGPEFGTWLPGGQIWGSSNPKVTYEALDVLIERLPDDHPRVQEIQGFSRQFTIPVYQLKGELSVDTDESITTILTGSFDEDTALEGQDVDSSQIRTSGDFLVLGRTQAVGPGSLIVSSTPQTFVDTKRGEADPIYEVDDHWADVLANVGESHVVKLVAPSDAKFEVLGLGVDLTSGTNFEGTAYAHYTSEDAAGLHMNELGRHVKDLASEDVDTSMRGVNQDGNVVEVDVSYSQLPF